MYVDTHTHTHTNTLSDTNTNTNTNTQAKSKTERSWMIRLPPFYVSMWIGTMDSSKSMGDHESTALSVRTCHKSESLQSWKHKHTTSLSCFRAAELKFTKFLQGSFPRMCSETSSHKSRLAKTNPGLGPGAYSIPPSVFPNSWMHPPIRFYYY